MQSTEWVSMRRELLLLVLAVHSSAGGRGDPVCRRKSRTGTSTTAGRIAVAAEAEAAEETEKTPAGSMRNRNGGIECVLGEKGADVD